MREMEEYMRERLERLEERKRGTKEVEDDRDPTRKKEDMLNQNLND